MGDPNGEMLENPFKITELFCIWAISKSTQKAQKAQNHKIPKFPASLPINLTENHAKISWR